MGVVYRAGAEAWFTTHIYDSQVRNLTKSDYGKSKDGFSAGEATYVLDPIFGNSIMGMLKISVSPPLEGCIIMCYPDTLSRYEVLNLTAHQDSRGTWTVPLTFDYHPHTPTLNIKPPLTHTDIFGGDEITATCESFVRANGSIFWKFTTQSHVYRWNKKGDKNREPLPRWLTIKNEQEQKNYSDFERPRYRSELRLIMHRQFENAHLECFSDTEEGIFVYPGTKKSISTSASTAFNFIFLLSVPELDVKYVGIKATIVEANCSAYVGSKGALQWELLISNWLRYCWTVDTHGIIKGTLPPFIIQDNKTKGQITYTYNNRTGPHIISYIMFNRPQGWKKFQLGCTVDNPHRSFAIRQQDKRKMAKFEKCKQDLKSLTSLMQFVNIGDYVLILLGLTKQICLFTAL
ncbi:hypothetical protein PoB_005573700 [Plakobranchus ocellatus]|uniref:Ig-like domain-containing protein n=1 Tax=Plakobranchus ocellatus TaxID=259542 RepID=A0AAV4CCF0_9GAST|nr:hypothetical protein PoB_005573700 [Plakobranchus ocellatus]